MEHKITFIIPNDSQFQRIIDAENGLNPVRPPEFNEAQWAKEVIRRRVRDDVARWEQSSAREAITFQEDDSIIS